MSTNLMDLLGASGQQPPSPGGNQPPQPNQGPPPGGGTNLAALLGGGGPGGPPQAGPAGSGPPPPGEGQEEPEGDEKKAPVTCVECIYSRALRDGENLAACLKIKPDPVDDSSAYLSGTDGVLLVALDGSFGCALGETAASEGEFGEEAEAEDASQAS